MARHPTPENTFDPTRYPRTYPASNVNRISYILLCAGLILGMPWMYSTSPHASANRNYLIIVISCVLWGVGLLLAILRYKVILEPDAIVVRQLLSTRRLRRSEIAGSRTVRGRYGSESQILIPRDENERKLTFPVWMEKDLDFLVWFDDISRCGSEESSGEVTIDNGTGGGESTDAIDDDLDSDDISDLVEKAQARMESARNWAFRALAAFLISAAAVFLFSERGPFHPYRPSLDEGCFFLSLALLFAFVCGAVAWWDNWRYLGNLRKANLILP